MCFPMSDQPSARLDAGPATSKSSTYTLSISFSLLWKYVDGQSRIGSKPACLSTRLQWSSQDPPLSGWPYKPFFSLTTGHTYCPFHSGGQASSGSATHVSVPLSSACT